MKSLFARHLLFCLLGISIGIRIEINNYRIIEIAPVIHPALAETMDLSEAERLEKKALDFLQNGKYTEVVLLLLKSITIKEKILGVEHFDVAKSYFKLATVYQQQGKYIEAESLLIRTLQITDKAQGKGNIESAPILAILGQNYTLQGKYKEAEPLLINSVSIIRRSGNLKQYNIGIGLLPLGLIYIEQGQYRKAELVLQESLSVAEGTVGMQQVLLAQTLTYLGRLYQKQGDLDRAETFSERGLNVSIKLLGAKHPALIPNMLHLSGAYIFRKRYDKAEKLLQDALEISGRSLDPDHPNVSSILYNLAGIYMNQEKYDLAKPLLIRSLAIIDKDLKKPHLNASMILGHLGELFWIKKDFAQAIAYLDRGVRIEESAFDFNLLAGSEADKINFLSTRPRWVNALTMIHLQSLPNNIDAANLSLTTILRRKGRVLDAQTDLLQRLRQNLDPNNQQALNRFIQVRTQLANLSIKPEIKPQEVNFYQNQIQALQSESDQLEAELNRTNATFRIETQPISIETVRRNIPQNAALIEFIQYEQSLDAKSERIPHYAAYILRANGEIKWVDLGEAKSIDLLIGGECNLFEDRLNCDMLTSENLKQLNIKLMEPVIKLVGNAKHLIIAPDNQLNLVPFAALIDKKGQYLVENHTISYLTSGRDLLRLQSPPAPSNSPLMLVNPNYREPGIATDNINPATSRTSNIKTEFARDFRPLLATAQEGEAIKPFLPGVKLFSGSQATENIIKQSPSPRILHIATHGFFFPAQSNQGLDNPLTRSGLVLAGANQRSSGMEDGWLTALEVSNLNLQGTELVVLSACETGLGQVVAGEGVYGLRRAFTLAGARSQLTSLWKVNDQGTKDLMVDYYRRLTQGKSRAEALREVQLAMLRGELKGDNGMSYQSPYFWSSFIPIGDWKPLPSSSSY